MTAPLQLIGLTFPLDADVESRLLAEVDRIEGRGADERIVFCAVRSERVAAGRVNLRTALPPAMLPDHDMGIEVVVEAGAGAHTTLWGLDRHPVAIGDTACLRRLRMQFHFRMRGALTQTGQRAMLGLTEQGRLGVCQN